MRKKLLYIFITLLAVIIIAYVWRYKQAQIFENKVPANATKVVNINLRQIENHLLFDFLTNPITYLKPREKKDSIDEPKTSLTKGVSIPKNILFYSNSDEFKNSWFSSILEINDQEELFVFLQKEKFQKKDINDVVVHTKGNFYLAVKNGQLIIALQSDKKANINSVVNKLFENKDFLTEDDSLLKSIINNKSDISFSSNDDVLEANFKGGIFELQGTLNSDLFIDKATKKPDEDGVISLSGKINRGSTVFKKFLTDKKDKFNELTHLSLDSIVEKWNGKLSMNITSIEQKTDTIVSYEYDDDFNKVEIKSTQEKKIPTMNLVLGQENTSALSDYFYKKNAIQIIENDTVFTTIPIFKFLVADIKNDLELYVNQKGNEPNTLSATSKFSFYFNAKKYMETPLDVPLTKDQEKLLQLIKTTNLEWAKDNRFSFKIDLKNTDRNFLGQLIKQ